MTSEWRKAIPEKRDRLQSRVLVWVVGPVLLLICSAFLLESVAFRHQRSEMTALKALGVSLTFAGLVWALKAATPMAAVYGGAICFAIISWTEQAGRSAIYSGLPPLIVLFVLTFAATRVAKARKQRLGLVEDVRGRNSAQVIANLGAAAIMAPVAPFAMLAALCEAAADTVSSEIGTAFGGRPLLLTTLRSVPPGTDGAVSLPGTAAGIASAAIIATAAMWAMNMNLRDALVSLAGGIAGLIFDSIMGATCERQGYIGNDFVNLSSTCFAALVAIALHDLFAGRRIG